ncbi:hypothetical protein [[Clostridium] hylemonae]|uniref:hypothetical protein n=1 Tax=[Clostridium] hylemonae TaxID=89153 RepID=UPI001478791C|nr:hypothetical protein [[Clostridium] hylemonae]
MRARENIKNTDRQDQEIHPQEVWSAVVEVLEEAAVLCPEQIDGFAIAAWRVICSC